MVEEKKYEGAGDPIKIFLEEAREKQRNTMMDTFPKSFNGCPPVVHMHLVATLEAPLLSRYKSNSTFLYLKVRYMQTSYIYG